MANIQIPAEIIEQPKNYIESGAYLERFKIAHDPLEMPHVPSNFSNFFLFFEISKIWHLLNFAKV